MNTQPTLSNSALAPRLATSPFASRLVGIGAIGCVVVVRFVPNFVLTISRIVVKVAGLPKYWISPSVIVYLVRTVIQCFTSCSFHSVKVCGVFRMDYI